MARTFSRPGVQGAVDLSSIKSRNEWTKIESQYKAMIHSKGGKQLTDLDNFRNTLAEKLCSNDNKKPYITKEELLQIVQWKFLKGKPRHALMRYLNSNSEKKVQDCSRNAFQKASKGQTKEALDDLCVLSGVGPATASAFLGLFRPNLFCFMADEVIECLYDGKRGYTHKIYTEVNTKCTNIAERLGEEWTSYRVGRALWTAARLYATRGSTMPSIKKTEIISTVVLEKEEAPKRSSKRLKRG